MPDVPKIEKTIPPGLREVTMMRLIFSGAFQCRLATMPDPTTFSGTDKKGELGTTALGWTFAYREKALDRVIRFSNPVQLRNALIDPWDDVKVTSLEVNPNGGKLKMGGGTMTKVGDPLIGKVVSLGSAMFNSKMGQQLGAREAIEGLSLNIGGGMFTADPANPPPLCKVMNPDVKPWAQEYEVRKPQLIQSHQGSMDPVRRKYLANEEFKGHLPDGLAYSFRESGDYVGELKNVKCNLATKFDPKTWRDTPFKWTIDLTFFRFDGDTLTGRVDGQIYATAI